MSLSRKDDPRTWLVPGPRAVPRPPLDARLLYYDVTTNERALLRAMCEVSKDGLGNGCWATRGTYAEISGLSERTIWDLIHGRKYKNGRHTIGLLDRRILIEDAKVKKPSRRLRKWHTVPAIYSINEAALALKPEILERLEAGVQQTIPGIPRPPRPGEPVEVASEHPARGAGSTRHHVHDHPAPGADDTKAFDSETLYTKAVDTKAGENSNTPPAPKDLAKKLCLEIAFPATPGNMTAVAAALEAVQKQYGLASYQQSFDWLKTRAQTAITHQDKLKRFQFDRFFFEDAEYNRTRSEDEQRAFDAWAEQLKAGASLTELFAEPVSLALDAPQDIVGKCRGCGRPKFASSSWSEYCAESCRAQYQSNTKG